MTCFLKKEPRAGESRSEAALLRALDAILATCEGHHEHPTRIAVDSVSPMRRLPWQGECRDSALVPICSPSRCRVSADDTCRQGPEAGNRWKTTHRSEAASASLVFFRYVVGTAGESCCIRPIWKVDIRPTSDNQSFGTFHTTTHLAAYFCQCSTFSFLHLALDSSPSSSTFRSQDLNGWIKAPWVIFVIILPFLGVFVYSSLVEEDAGAQGAGNSQQKTAFDQESRRPQERQEGVSPPNRASWPDSSSQGVLTDAEVPGAKGEDPVNQLNCARAAANGGQAPRDCAAGVKSPTELNPKKMAQWARAQRVGRFQGFRDVVNRRLLGLSAHFLHRAHGEPPRPCATARRMNWRYSSTSSGAAFL